MFEEFSATGKARAVNVATAERCREPRTELE